MAAILAPLLRQRFFDADGAPLAYGKLYTYEINSTTPKATYTSNTGLTANANPVVLDADGYADVWILTGYYKFLLTDADDVEQWSKDYVSLPVLENGFSTGDVKLSLKTVADTGFVLMDDKTIGNAASSATGRANADTEALFALLWTNTANADCAVSTGRGASAAADYAANKTIALPKALGRALATYGTGSGLSARALAAITGAETVALTEANLPAHAHTFAATSSGQSQSHTHQVTGINAGASGRLGGFVNGIDTDGQQSGAASQDHTHTISGTTGNGAGSATAVNKMQPTLFLNIMIKL